MPLQPTRSLWLEGHAGTYASDILVTSLFTKLVLPAFSLTALNHLLPRGIS